MRGRGRHQGDLEPDAGVVDREASGEIVASVEHQIVAAEQLFGVGRIDARFDRDNLRH
jgi:hypothetical protein